LIFFFISVFFSFVHIFIRLFYLFPKPTHLFRLSLHSPYTFLSSYVSCSLFPPLLTFHVTAIFMALRILFFRFFSSPFICLLSFHPSFLCLLAFHAPFLCLHIFRSHCFPLSTFLSSFFSLPPFLSCLLPLSTFLSFFFSLPPFLSCSFPLSTFFSQCFPLPTILSSSFPSSISTHIHFFYQLPFHTLSFVYFLIILFFSAVFYFRRPFPCQLSFQPPPFCSASFPFTNNLPLSFHLWPTCFLPPPPPDPPAALVQMLLRVYLTQMAVYPLD
jgi:hypothetical protein